MALRVQKFATIEDLQAFLRGVVRTRKLNGPVMGLVGLTLIFSQPTAATCTFVAGADASGLTLTFKEICDQLKSAVTDLTVDQKEGAILLRSSNADGVTITGGTARTLLGLQTGANSVGTIINPAGGSAPTYVNSYFCGDSHVLVYSDS